MRQTKAIQSMALVFLIYFVSTADAFVVKTIFFKPKNAAVVPDNQISRIVKEAQTLYANEMERQGFGRKTFRLAELQDYTCKISNSLLDTLELGSPILIIWEGANLQFKEHDRQRTHL